MAIHRELKATISRVFQDPAPYTKNSLKVTKTRNHNMQASVWFKEPDRMGDHYLLPQVEGGERKEKGFERALSHTKFIPSDHLPLDRYGNVAPGLIRQILSVLGRAELAQGYQTERFQANRTRKIAIRNPKGRDFAWLPKGGGGSKL
jgi:hypothetical protein